MRSTVWSVVLAMCMLCVSEIAGAREDIYVKPLDMYISGLGGYSFPFKTDVTAGGSFGSFTFQNVDLENSPSYGGKIGVWFTESRKTWGIDIGTEGEIVYFDPDPSLRVGYFGINVLARVPMEVSTDLPNGRWFPYIGLGGGVQHLRSNGFGSPDDTASAFQGLGGVKVFLLKHLAVFVEAKFTHAAHRLESNDPGFGNVSRDFPLNSLHGVGGLSLHL